MRRTCLPRTIPFSLSKCPDFFFFFFLHFFLSLVMCIPRSYYLMLRRHRYPNRCHHLKFSYLRRAFDSHLSIIRDNNTIIIIKHKYLCSCLNIILGKLLEMKWGGQMTWPCETWMKIAKLISRKHFYQFIVPSSV